MTHGPSQEQVPVRPGDVLAGKYRVVRVLGVGGMGVVVAAHHLQLDEPVALKFLLPDAARNESVRGRFLREGQAAVKIKSEHVARTLDVGTLETGAPYLVMELLEGTDLSDKLKLTGPLPLDLAIEYLLQAAHAIGVAHSLGIVHRDIKPANLFLTRRPDGSECIKVLDFGISKIKGDTGFDMTSTGAILGSPYYMSPEQFMSSKHVDPRADIWSLGAVFYQFLMGRPPYQGDSIGELVAQVLQAPPPIVARPDVPPALNGVIARALAKNVADRFSTVTDLGAALAPFASDRSRTSLDRLAGFARSKDSESQSQRPSFSNLPPSQPFSGPLGGTTPLPAVTPLPLGSETGPRPLATGSSWGTNSGAASQRAPKSNAPVVMAIGAGLLTVVGIVVAVGLGIGRTSSVTPTPSANASLAPTSMTQQAAETPPTAEPAPAASVPETAAAAPEPPPPSATATAETKKASKRTPQRPPPAAPSAKPTAAAVAAPPVIPDDRK